MLSFPFPDSLQLNKSQRSLIIQWSFLPITRIIKTQSQGGLGLVLFTSSFWGHFWECGCSEDTIHLSAQMLVKGNTSLHLFEIPGRYCGLKKDYKTEQDEQTRQGVLYRTIICWFISKKAPWRHCIIQNSFTKTMMFPCLPISVLHLSHLLVFNYVDCQLLLDFRKTKDCFTHLFPLLSYDIKSQNIQGLSVYQRKTK